MSASRQLPVVRDQEGLRTELHPEADVVYLINADGDAVRLRGSQVQRAACLLMAAHVDRGRYRAEAAPVEQRPRRRKP